MQQLGLCLQAGSHFGWGIFTLNVTLQLLRRGRVAPRLLAAPSQVITDPLQARLLAPVLAEAEAFERAFAADPRVGVLDCPVLHPLGNDCQITDRSRAVTGPAEAAMVFLEDTRISDAGRRRALRFDRVIAGSTWAGEVLAAAGLPDLATVIQGIDPSLFHPAPAQGLFGDRFVVFSGGKLEFRKGQDIILAAFRRFHERHPEALLLTCWANPWGASMAESPHCSRPLPRAADGGTDIPAWIAAEGLRPEAVVSLPAQANLLMPIIMREAHLAVFPNRCEGGTNLVAMEAMACGVPTVLSANTGHFDLIGDDTCYPLTRQPPVAGGADQGRDGWGESDIDELVAVMEDAFQDRAEAARRGANGARLMTGLTWEHQTDRLMAVLADLG